MRQGKRLRSVGFVRAGIRFHRRGFVAELEDLQKINGKERRDAAGRLVLPHVAKLMRDRTARIASAADENRVSERQADHAGREEPSLFSRLPERGLLRLRESFDEQNPDPLRPHDAGPSRQILPIARERRALPQAPIRFALGPGNRRGKERRQQNGERAQGLFLHAVGRITPPRVR